MEHSEVRKGQKIRVDHPKSKGDLYEVIKINSVNIKLRNLRTMGILNCHPSFMRPEGTAPTFAAYVPALTEGTIVTVKSAKIKGLHVVIRANANSVSIARLGGNSSGWRVSQSSLTVIPLEDLIETLA